MTLGILLIWILSAIQTSAYALIRYNELTKEFGETFYGRIEAKVTPEQKEKLSKVSPAMVKQKDLAGEKIINLLTKAPGNGADIGGLNVRTKNDWFAA